jgi:hypothetical protein
MGAVVSLRGSETAEFACLNGTFQFQVTRELNGLYSFELFQSDAAGNRSPSVNHTWTRDGTRPPAPALTSHPAVSLSNQERLTLGGICEPGALVVLTGASALLSACPSGSFRFELAPGTDGTNSYTIHQSDPAGNVSESTSFFWTRDTSPPAPPIRTAPGTANPISSSNLLRIEGTCENGAQVRLTGDHSASTPCMDQGFFFEVQKEGDGVYSFSLVQGDPAGNTSVATALTWTRDTSVPAEPLLLSPSVRNPVTSQDLLNLGGNCQTGARVEMNGAASEQQVCSDGTFSFAVRKTLDGNYPLSIRQVSASGVASTAVALSWTRDTRAPEAPVILQPSVPNPITSSDSELITGTCETGASVIVSGDTLETLPCGADGRFSHVLTSKNDGRYSVMIRQRDVAGNESTANGFTWQRDTQAPEALDIQSPASNPFVSGNDLLLVSGTCEPGVRILFSEDGSDNTQDTLCSVLGFFQIQVKKDSDGTFTFHMLQKDQAGNLSPISDLIWTRDTTLPFSPEFSPSLQPHLSREDTLRVTTTCLEHMSPAPARVTLAGDVSEAEMVNPPGSLSGTCQGGKVLFEVRKKTDGTYRFVFAQENPNTGFSSPPSDFVWIRDTSPPAPPVLLSPPGSTFTSPGNLMLSGRCEPGASVHVRGGVALSIPCDAEGRFSGVVDQKTDGTYSFSLSQADPAGNESATTSLRWIRDSSAIPVPVIHSPTALPVLSTQDQLILSGTCLSGYTLNWRGDAEGSVLCVQGSFTISVPASSDGTRTYEIFQSIQSSRSSAIGVTWIRDTTAPNTKILDGPPQVQLDKSSTFSFSASEPDVRFECRFDQSTFQACTSPITLGSASNGTHRFDVRAIDLAGNTGPTTSREWTQASYNTLALYHLGATSTLLDFGFFTANKTGFNHSLVSSPAVTPSLDSTGKLPGRGLNSLLLNGTTLYSVPANSALNSLARKTLTIEGFVKVTKSLPSINDTYTLVSQSGSTAPDFGWEVRLRRGAKTNSYVLEFTGSLDGISPGKTVSSSSFSIPNTGTWNYFAVTFNQGSVAFYFGSTIASSRGIQTIGPLGSAALSTTTAPLRIGHSATSTTSGPNRSLIGAVDELRISQTVRPLITLPVTEFSPD